MHSFFFYKNIFYAVYKNIEAEICETSTQEDFKNKTDAEIMLKRR